MAYKLRNKDNPDIEILIAGEGGGSDYTLPVATGDTLGGVRVGERVFGDDDAVSIDTNTGRLYSKTYTEYELPQAKEDALGGVKADERSNDYNIPVAIDPLDGKLYAKDIQQASHDVLGGIIADPVGEGYSQEVKISTTTGKLFVKPEPAPDPDKATKFLMPNETNFRFFKSLTLNEDIETVDFGIFSGLTPLELLSLAPQSTTVPRLHLAMKNEAEGEAAIDVEVTVVLQGSGPYYLEVYLRDLADLRNSDTLFAIYPDGTVHDYKDISGQNWEWDYETYTLRFMPFDGPGNKVRIYQVEFADVPDDALTPYLNFSRFSPDQPTVWEEFNVMTAYYNLLAKLYTGGSR